MTPAHVQCFPWNNVVIPSGIDWDSGVERGGAGQGRGRERENKYAAYDTVDSIGKECHCLYFQA